MKSKTILKIATDIAMTASLLLLMTYELIGQALHEWIGIGIFVLFVLHHILNGKWSRNLLRGKYNALRVMQSAIVVLVLLSMIGSAVSGVILSRHALAFLPIRASLVFARRLHMLSAYWGFVFISLHLGFHWGMIIGMTKKLVKKKSQIRKWILRGIAALITVYGIYAFIKRDIGSYMLLKNQFVFFDFEEPVILFITDYAAVMGMFVFIGHYFTCAVRKMHGNKG